MPHWLTPSGTEIYHPLAWSASRADDWFVSTSAGLERRRLARYSADGGDEVATFLRNVAALGMDIGQPWGDVGELRLGWSRLVLRTDPLLVSARLGNASIGKPSWTEDALRAQLVLDQIDFAMFPQSGYRGPLALCAGQRHGDLSGGFYRAEAEATGVRSLGANTFEAFARVHTAERPQAINLPRYNLGGFHQLSGQQARQLTGNHVLLLRLGWYRRLSCSWVPIPASALRAPTGMPVGRRRQRADGAGSAASA